MDYLSTTCQATFIYMRLYDYMEVAVTLGSSLFTAPGSTRTIYDDSSIEMRDNKASGASQFAL